MKAKTLLTFGLVTGSTHATDQTVWWCTAGGITLAYEKEVVWGDDQATLTEAEAHALANCRATLSQCRVLECSERKFDKH